MGVVSLGAVAIEQRASRQRVEIGGVRFPGLASGVIGVLSLDHPLFRTAPLWPLCEVESGRFVQLEGA